MMGRKRVDLETLGTRSPRQRIWEAIRANRESFTADHIVWVAKVKISPVRKYLLALVNGGFIEVASGGGTTGKGKFAARTMRLVRDIGAEAPAIAPDGSPGPTLCTEAMWRTLRILREVDAQTLVDQAAAIAPVALGTAKQYLTWLNRAGYVQIVAPAKRGAITRYRLVPARNSGPKAPIVQKGVVQVFDPNLGEVVHREQPEVDQ